MTRGPERVTGGGEDWVVRGSIYCYVTKIDSDCTTTEGLGR